MRHTSVARGGEAGLRREENLRRLQAIRGKRPDDPGSLGGGNELVA
jgi:hypothetical protein